MLWPPGGFASACGRSQIEPLPNPIQVPGAPWYFDSFIVDAPREEGWASFSKDAKSAEMGKKYEDGHTAAAIVEAHKFQEPVMSQDALLAIVKQTSAAIAEPGTKLADYTTEILTPKGLLCARSVARFEDRARAVRAGRHPAGARLDLRATGPPRDRRGPALRRAHARRGQPPRARMMSASSSCAVCALRRSASTSSPRHARRSARRTVRKRCVCCSRLPNRATARPRCSSATSSCTARGSPRTRRSARKWLEIAAGQGRIDAIYNLGAIYDKGIGVPRNAGEAIKWFTLAADQRDPTSQLNLALFYLKGDGVEKSIPTAELWLKRSANNGGKRAQGILASGAYKKQ